MDKSWIDILDRSSVRSINGVNHITRKQAIDDRQFIIDSIYIIIVWQTRDKVFNVSWINNDFVTI